MSTIPEQLFVPALSRLIQPKANSNHNLHRLGRFKPTHNPLKMRCKSYYHLNEARERTKAMVSLINKVSNLYTSTIKRRVSSTDKLAKLPSYESEPPCKKYLTAAGVMAPHGNDEKDYMFIIQPLDLQHTTDFKPISQNSTQKYDSRFKPNLLNKKDKDYEEPHGFIEEITNKNQKLRNKIRSCFLVDSPKKKMSYFLPNSKQLNLSKVQSKGNIKPHRQPPLKSVNTEKSLAAQPSKSLSETFKSRNLTPDLQNVVQSIDSKKVLFSCKSNACVNTNFEVTQAETEIHDNSILNSSRRLKQLNPYIETSIQLSSNLISETLCDKYKPKIANVSIFNESENLSGWNVSKSPRNAFEVIF